MKLHNFIGIDVGKSNFAFTLLRQEEPIDYGTVANNKAAIKGWYERIKQQFRAGGKNTLFCVEHTGVYSEELIAELSKRKSQIWVESALQIKRTLGLVRGKSDKIDSLRIAEYAFRYQRKVHLWKNPRAVINKLNELWAAKRKFESMLMSIKSPLEEKTRISSRTAAKELRSIYAKSIEQLTTDLKSVEAGIKKLMASDVRLTRLSEILRSIPGIGPVLSIELILCTNEFLKFKTSKKFCCYCGVAPFEYSSGTSVKRKTKVSPFSNRKMKRALHFPAISCIVHDEELRKYYLRKVAEGHPKMSVLNAVKNKLVHRAFACVRDDRLFEKEYTPKARVVEHEEG
jgi:transposase